MLIVVQVLALLSGALHVYIWAMECLLFGQEKIHSGVFGVRSEHVETVRSWAFNQGFYNLFLAVGAIAGALMVRAEPPVGWTLIVFACGSMLGAALVLVVRDRAYAKAAATQGTLPLLTLLAALTQL